MTANTQTHDRLGERLRLLAQMLLRPLYELYLGIHTNSLPTFPLAIASLLIGILLLTRADVTLFSGARFLYPKPGMAYGIYAVFVLCLPFLSWGFLRTLLHLRFVRRLEAALITSNLKNRLGKTPTLLTDRSIDPVTRKLRLTSANFPKKDFEGAKDAMEAGLRIFIDDIREHRKSGTIEVIYSHEPMPARFDMPNIDDVRSLQFFIGKTRSSEIKTDLRQTPHLLLAGQTGGGKSTFLRQFITTLYLRNKSMKFTLIDLKGGLEFQTFENLKRTSVVPDIQFAIRELESIETQLVNRMKALKDSHSKDIDDQRRLAQQGSHANRAFARHLIVIDEASEMFLVGHHADPQKIQKARRILSQIARQGRAVGFHLVIATQRPDTRSLDPQIKANLTGILCFQMANDASSLTVLGNGRATDLPPVPERAIWKRGIEMVEVQTPLLSPESAESLLLKELLPPGEIKHELLRDPGLSPSVESQNGETANNDSSLLATIRD